MCRYFQGWEGIYSSQGDCGLLWCLEVVKFLLQRPHLAWRPDTRAHCLHACPRRSGCRSVQHVGRLLGWRCDKLRTADQQRMCDDLIEELGGRTAEERGRDVAEKGQPQG